MTKLTRRKMLQATVAAGAGATTLGRRSSAWAQSQPIKLPFFTTLSGPVSLVGIAMKQGAELTVQLINKNGGVLGRSLELVFFDDKGRANDMIAAAREGASMGLGYVTGGVVSGFFPSLVPLMTETKTVCLLGSGSNPATTNEAFSRYIFPGSENDLQRARVLGKLAADKFPDVKSYAGICSEVQSYIKSYSNFEKSAKTEYGKIGKSPSYAEPQVVKLGTGDFRTVLSQLSTADNDALFNMVVAGDGLTFWKQAKPFDLVKKYKAVIDQTMDFVALKSLKKDMPPNLWTITMWYHELHKNSELSNAFYKEYVAQTKDTLPSGYLAYGAAPILAFAAAVKHTNGKTDAESLINALETIRFDNLKGETYFRKEDHLMISEIDVVNVVPSDDAMGITVANAVKYNTKDLSPPPNPGKPVQD